MPGILIDWISRWNVGNFVNPQDVEMIFLEKKNTKNINIFGSNEKPMHDGKSIGYSYHTSCGFNFNQKDSRLLIFKSDNIFMFVDVVLYGFNKTRNLILCYVSGFVHLSCVISIF